jgi:hypothetical protein
MKNTMLYSLTVSVALVFGTNTNAAGREPAITKESKEYLDKLREHGFREVRERKEQQSRASNVPSAPSRPAGPSLQELKQKENMAIQKGYKRAMMQYVVKGAVEASHRILSRKDTSLMDVLELILTHEDRQQQGREHDTKVMLEVFEELERERQLHGVEAIRGFDPDPEVLNARGTYQWCVNHLPEENKRQSLNARLAAVERCFKKMPPRCCEWVM